MPDTISLSDGDGHDRLLERATALMQGRAVLGIAGAPGAGKSTLGQALVEALDRTVVVGMDGFHLTNDELVRLGRRDRKGAPDTFDVHGYIALLHRLKNESTDVYAPAYQRGIGHSIAGAIRVPADTSLIITEGNYLLLDDGPWKGVRSLLDETLFVEIPDHTRIDRLIARHVESGKTADAAREWTLGPDQANADLVRATRENADLVITLGT